MDIDLSGKQVLFGHLFPRLMSSLSTFLMPAFHEALTSPFTMWDRVPGVGPRQAAASGGRGRADRPGNWSPVITDHTSRVQPVMAGRCRAAESDPAPGRAGPAQVGSGETALAVSTGLRSAQCTGCTAERKSGAADSPVANAGTPCTETKANSAATVTGSQARRLTPEAPVGSQC